MVSTMSRELHNMEPVKVFIIDDSAVVREILTTNLAKYPQIEVIGTAIDPYIARKKIVKQPVDVVTLDIELPRMDGLTFLKYLMKYYPLPVVIVSSLADTRNAASMEALELGAVDIVPKPGGPYSVGDIIELLVDKIIAASKVNFDQLQKNVQQNAVKTTHRGNYLTKITTTKKLIAIGASTGGTSALEILLKDFEKTFPPAVVVIHMPEKFTETFAGRLNSICNVTVTEASDGEIAEYGHVYIAPGNFHCMIEARGTSHIIRVKKGPKVHHQRPAVDVLFKSVAGEVGKNSIGAVLTGMGRDGARGLLEIKNKGGFTIAQDEHTSIVFGMPKEAIDLGAAGHVMAINKITRRIADFLLKAE